MNEDLTQVAVTWKHTGDAQFPYTAEVGGRTYTIRINDFPAEPLYTLLSEGAELGDLEDWPAAWVMPSPPKALRDTLTRRIGPRHEGAVRLAATSEPGDEIDALALDGEEVVAGGSRRLDLATLRERTPKPLEHRAPAAIVLDGGGQERVLALAPECGLAVSALTSEHGDEVRLHWLRSRTMRAVAIRRPTILAASISPNGRSIVILDETGHVSCYDLSSRPYPSSARARNVERGGRASIDLARDGRLWVVAAGASVEVHLMSDDEPVATVDLSPLGDQATSVRFLPDAGGFLVGTARGVVMRFELLLDRVGASRDARIAAIADAVDAAIAGTCWRRYAPRVEVYDERTESGRTTLYFVADHYEYHHAQSGSDWAEHDLCAGHATFEGERRVEVRVASTERRRLTEREDESYDPSATLAVFRASTARERSSSTVVPGADGIKRVFDAHFASYRVTFPERSLHSGRGKFSENGWDVHYRFGEESGTVCLDVRMENRMTNERLYRVYADGRVDMIGATTDGVLGDVDRAFYEEVHRRFS